jgi:predicted MFS family arabinose efflux permease
MSDEPVAERKLTAGLGIFALFAFAYLLSFAMRTVGAVIAPELVRDFELSHTQLGSLSSAYFLAFAVLQLPLGIWLDQYGSRRTHSSLLVLAALGCVLFASAQSSVMLWIGRGLIGAGVAGALMAALKAFRFWFAPVRQQSLAAWMLMSGSLGALSVTVPTRWAMNWIGWRDIFWLAGGLFLLAALLLFTMLPRDEERQSVAMADGRSSSSLWSGYREVFCDAYFWRFAMMSLLAHAPFISMQSLWAGPWLIQVMGFTPAGAAQVLLVFNLTLLMGFLSVGFLLPWVRRLGWSTARITAVGCALMAATQGLIVLAIEPQWWFAWPALALISTFFAIVQPHVSLSFPSALTGRAYTAYNLLIFTGIFVWQWLFGAMVDGLHMVGLTTVNAFRVSLLAATFLQLAGLVVFCIWRPEPRALE